MYINLYIILLTYYISLTPKYILKMNELKHLESLFNIKNN